MPNYAQAASSVGIFSVDITPVSADGAALGTIALPWSDLRLATGAVIDLGNDVTLTHSTDALTLAGGVLSLPDGALGAPSLSFASLGATGGFYDSEGDSGLNLGFLGVKRFTFSTNQFQLHSDPGYLLLGINNLVYLMNEATAILQMGLDAAAPVAQTFKGPDARAGTDTDTVGGRINWRTGLSTGNAVPAIQSMQGGAATVTSGTGAQSVVDRFIPNAFKVLADNVATAVLNATNANGSSVGGLITYTIEVWDGTDNQVETGQAVYSSKNKAGVVTGTITEINSQQDLDSGTLATTWAISAANPAVISVNANSSLTPSTGFPRITFSLQNLGQQAVAVQ